MRSEVQSQVTGQLAGTTAPARGGVRSPPVRAARSGPAAGLARAIAALPTRELLALHAAAKTSVGAFEDATQRHGSLLQCWIRGQTVVESEHYPLDDVIDAASGSQYFYHAHRSAAAEHGHLHLFWHADARGRRARRKADRGARKSAWAPTHLAAIGLDDRGMPVSLFTVNRWVTNGHWFDAPATLALFGRFDLRAAGPYALANRWLSAFVRLYRPLLGPLLGARDARVARLTATRPWAAVAADRRIEVLSHVAIDWARDLDALEGEITRRR